MFNFKRVDEVPLPIWLSQQAVAATPANAERERLLREDDKAKDKKCHRRVRTLALIITLVFTIALLVALIMLVVQAITTVSSAKASVGAKVELLMNETSEAMMSTKASINALRGVSQRAELFSVTSFDHLANATRHMDEMSNFVSNSIIKAPISLKLVG